ncbi:hypothetical protein GA830_12035 [Mesorhizobium sp. NBSH29]|uniref:hypothetical protein n=1 Tax=Mesorhizobium sp. NBSH29 TaxID=2654249 RepID=UPI0018966FC4|nr:hypothetical protein [Mesorhizobium sp. NBSH29]QPC87387.1 hypothetical protein GA830_12035 [Mesorhizobium sp. NBSH29]
MADHPILFTGPMVRAILREIEQPGTGKTQTRRVLKPRPPEGARYAGIHYARNEPDSHFFDAPGGPAKVPARVQEGDRLWVRECFKPVHSGNRSSGAKYRGDVACDETSWKPSIHMPRWASRITLSVTAVRVQQLHEISEEDATAEGCFRGVATGRVFHDATAMRLGGDEWSSARYWFADLWDSINARRGFSWDENPWVVAYTFSPILANIDASAS